MNVLQALGTITGITALILLGTVRLPGQAGAVDPTFDPGTGADSYVLSTLLQPDGRILIGGGFASFNGMTRNNLARLNSDGSIHATFDPASGPGNFIRSMTLDSLNRILVAGDFFIPVRFNFDGTRDSSFAPPGVYAKDIAIDSSGWIMIVGNFPDRILRLFSDGTHDYSFYAGHRYSFDYGINTFALRADGNIVIGGGFDFIADQFRPGIAELDSTGALVPNAFIEGFDNEVDALAIQLDGKVLAGGGDYTQFHGWVTRYDAAGAVDPSFTPPFTDRFVLALAVQSDGKILVGGTFTIINGLDQSYVVRLNPDGTVDSTFNVGTSANGPVADIKIQPDGRILLVGGFTTFNSVPRSGIVRLLGDTPVLNTQRGPRDTIINSWPAAYTNWVLQETKHLKHDKWKTVRTRPVTLNGINYVTEVIHGKGNAGKFYRLAKP